MEEFAKPPRLRSATDRLAAAFLDRTLPKAEWTHHAHLRVGLWHLLRYSPDEALTRLREGIRAFNDVCGVANTAASGYHESITRFYVWQIGRFLAEAQPSLSEDELAEALIRDYGDRNLPLRYWSQPVLMSTQARLGWVEPDRERLPGALPDGDVKHGADPHRSS